MSGGLPNRIVKVLALSRAPPAVYDVDCSDIYQGKVGVRWYVQFNVQCRVGDYGWSSVHTRETLVMFLSCVCVRRVCDEGHPSATLLHLLLQTVKVMRFLLTTHIHGGGEGSSVYYIEQGLCG